ncbi:MAG: nucleotidyl transferase AbiEii/AbiGii toxin family protein [Candidatus Shapirobacteria bacterium]|jgi:predicted nucleotidyltransferase component of viral defense system
MKALDITKHKTNLTNILIDIYKNSTLGPVLGFKGGTAAMLFYNLSRFSVDLDFDLIAGFEKNSPELKIFTEKMSTLLSTKYEIKDQSTKYNTLFWLVSYGSGLANIKVEVSTRDNPYNHYNLIPFYGVTIKVLDIKDMIAHKLVAVIERGSLANRDLFDIHYFLSSPFAGEINYDIIKHRTGKEPKEFYVSLLEFLSKINPTSVLAGLGEVLTGSQKDWAKAKLISELKGLVQRQIDLF